MAPAVVCGLSDLKDTADVGNGFALGNELISCFELADDLLGCVVGSFHGGVATPAWPDVDSHSPWTDSTGPRQYILLRQGLVFAAQLLLQAFDLRLVLLLALLEIRLFANRQQRLGIGILGGLTPAVHLLGEQATVWAVATKFSRVVAGCLQHHCELVSWAPSIGILVGGLHNLPLLTASLVPLIDSDQVDAQLLGDFGHDLTMEKPHPPAEISFDSLAVSTQRSTPSGPVMVEVVGRERRQLFWHKGCKEALCILAADVILIIKIISTMLRLVLQRKNSKKMTTCQQRNCSSGV